MSNLIRIAVLLVLIAVAPVIASEASDGRDPLVNMRRSVSEARLQMSASNWGAAERVLKSLRQQITLEPALDKFRTRVDFVLWDLRMNNHDAAIKDLDALGDLIGVSRPNP